MSISLNIKCNFFKINYSSFASTPAKFIARSFLILICNKCIFFQKIVVLTFCKKDMYMSFRLIELTAKLFNKLFIIIMPSFHEMSQYQALRFSSSSSFSTSTGRVLRDLETKSFLSFLPRTLNAAIHEWTLSFSAPLSGTENVNDRASEGRGITLNSLLVSSDDSTEQDFRFKLASGLHADVSPRIGNRTAKCSLHVL